METAPGSLGEDLELSIIARVPCHKTLLNAMYARKSWRKGLYSPKFRRQFCSLHSAPPILGWFSNESTQVTTVPTFPSFTITRDPDPKINAIVQKGDFFLTKVLSRTSSEPICWEISDCVDGLLLLMNMVTRKLTVYNPMTCWSSDLFDECSEDILFEGMIERAEELPPRLVPSDANPSSFHVIVVATENEGRVRTAVFSSTKMNWSVGPWKKVAPFGNLEFTDIASIGNKSLYWGSGDRECLLVLDQETLEFSTIQLPDDVRFPDLTSSQLSRVRYGFGEVEGGKPCVVVTQEQLLIVFVRESSPNGDEWVTRNTVNLITQLSELLPEEMEDCDRIADRFKIHGIVHETLFFHVLYHPMREEPHWCLSMRLDTMKLQKLFRCTSRDSNKFPYFVGWPSSSIDAKMMC
jgi:hypothetical protein